MDATQTKNNNGKFKSPPFFYNNDWSGEHRSASVPIYAIQIASGEFQQVASRFQKSQVASANWQVKNLKITCEF